MGDIWVDKNEINVPYDIPTVTVNVGADQFVEVDKLFGPQCSSKIRVKHDYQACAWVVEEENFKTGEWVERVRFYAQEFYKEKYNKDNL